MPVATREISYPYNNFVYNNVMLTKKVQCDRDNSKINKHFTHLSQLARAAQIPIMQ